MIDFARHRFRPTDPPLDFCLWPYDRPAQPAASALRTSALLFESFRLAGVSVQMEKLVDAMQGCVGRFRTVWGLKWDGVRPSWEFYFYDYDRLLRKRGISQIIEATGGIIEWAVPPADHVPYFMYSIEIGVDLAPVTQIDLYIGNPGSVVSSGICYGWDGRRMELRNFYFFFDAATEATEIRDKLTESAHLQTQELDLEQWLWPDIQPQTVVVSNKRNRDGLYFSRVDTDMLVRCMVRLSYPQALIDFTQQNRDNLRHHLFDVGWDWRVDATRPVPVKGSFYGIF